MLDVAVEVFVEDIDLEVGLPVSALVPCEKTNRGIVEVDTHRGRRRLGALRQLQRLLGAAEGIATSSDR
jgi:hypothetical protein